MESDGVRTRHLHRARRRSGHAGESRSPAPDGRRLGGDQGIGRHPVVDGTEANTFVEHYELHPIDRQTNGPQLFYGLRYHTHITKPGEVETFHDQVGYWLYEPAAQAVTLTLGIPRAQVLLASGPAGPDATEFELTATSVPRSMASCPTRSSTRRSAPSAIGSTSR